MKILLKNRHKYAGVFHPAGQVVDWPEEIATEFVKKGTATADLSYKSHSVPVQEIQKIDMEQATKKGKK